MKIRTRRSVAGLFAALITAGVVGWFPASGTAMADGSSSSAPVKEPPRVDIILDVSGSMRAQDISGKSRIAAAQEAFDEVVDALPPEAYLGVRTLGATYGGDDLRIGCQDTQQLAPVGPPDKTELKTAVATLRPTGDTPIGLALTDAAQDLGTGTATRRIVLITDGEDNCGPPDPCTVAHTLAAQGTHLVIDTLGLSPNDGMRSQLQCIADATGGTFTAVNTEEVLSTRVTQLVNRAVTTANDAPATVHGDADSCVNAPVLGAGTYSDRIEFQQHMWYRVPVLPGQELRASVSVGDDRPMARDYDVTMTALTTDGRQLARYTDSGSGRTDVQSAGVRYPAPRGADTSLLGGTSNSPDAHTVCLQVSTSFAPAAGTATTPGMPLELTVDVVKGTRVTASNLHGLGRGWVFVGLLAGTGLVFGLVLGRVVRAVRNAGRPTGGVA